MQSPLGSPVRLSCYYRWLGMGPGPVFLLNCLHRKLLLTLPSRGPQTRLPSPPQTLNLAVVRDGAQHRTPSSGSLCPGLVLQPYPLLARGHIPTPAFLQPRLKPGSRQLGPPDQTAATGSPGGMQDGVRVRGGGRAVPPVCAVGSPFCQDTPSSSCRPFKKPLCSPKAGAPSAGL